jgi:nitrilase
MSDRPVPTTPFRVAALQMVSTPERERNLEQAGRLIAQAALEGAQLVLLPEYFCFMGYKDIDKLAIRESAGDGPIQRFLADSARRHGLWVIGGTLPLAVTEPAPDATRVLNTTLVFDPSGEQRARYDKIHLFNFEKGAESFDEARTIRPGGEVRTFDAPLAFTYTTGRAHWEMLLRARAVENQCYVLAAAQGGTHENGRRTWGHSMLIDPWGEIVAVLDEGPGVVAGDIDHARIDEVRRSLPAWRHRVLA